MSEFLDVDAMVWGFAIGFVGAALGVLMAAMR
jgi:hypothetical protein